VLPNDFHFGADNLLAASDQVFNRDFRLAAPPAAAAIAVTVKAALLDAREVQDRFAQGFGGDSAGVGAGTAEDPVALDQGYLLAELGGLLPITTISTCFMPAPVCVGICVACVSVLAAVSTNRRVIVTLSSEKYQEI